MTSSPSSRKRRVSPDGSRAAACRPRSISSRLPQPSGVGRRDGAGAEEVAGLAGCSRCWCGARPSAPPSSRDGARCCARAVRRQARRAHAGGGAATLELEIERAAALVSLVAEIGQRRGVAGRARRLRDAERRQRLRRDDPGRDRRWRSSWRGTARAAGIPTPGCRAPTSRSAGRSRRCAPPPRRSEWARPARCRGRSRCRVPARNRALRQGPKLGASSSGALALAARAAHRRARDADRRGAAVIADGHVLVVGQQRIVGPEQPPDIQRVVDAGVEIRVVADRARAGAACRRRRGCSIGSQRRAASRRPRRAASRQPRAAAPGAARRPARRTRSAVRRSRQLRRSRRVAREDARRGRAARSRIMSPIATPPRRRRRPAGVKTPSGRFWMREIGVAVGRRHPAPARGIVRASIELRRHGLGLGGSKCFFSWRP